MVRGVSSMLIDGKFVAVFPRLVKALEGDIQGAAVLQHIHYRAGSKGKDPDPWMRLPLPEIAEEIGLSTDQVDRTTKRLRDAGLLLVKGTPGAARLWRINYEAVDALRDESTGPAISRDCDTSAPPRNHGGTSAKSRSTPYIEEEKNKSTPQPPAPQGASPSAKKCIDGQIYRQCTFQLAPRKCTDHDRHKPFCATCHTAADPPPPPWCGDCDPANRQIDMPTNHGPGRARCPRCHPLANQPRSQI